MDETLRSRPFVGSFRRWWWVVIAAAVVAAAVGYVVSSQSRPTYEATVRLLVGPFNASLDTQKAAGTLAATYTYYVTSQPVLDATSADLGGLTDGTNAWADTRANANQLTRIVSITVESDDAAAAARIANLLAENLSDQVTRGNLRPEAGLTVIEPAEAPTSSIGPKPLRAALASGIAAFLGVLALVVLIETTGIFRRRRHLEKHDGDEAGEALSES
jgi:capsular polysaccharide biosynthesis protein